MAQLIDDGPQPKPNTLLKKEENHKKNNFNQSQRSELDKRPARRQTMATKDLEFVEFSFFEISQRRTVEDRQY